jgi:nucleoside permease NupC
MSRYVQNGQPYTRNFWLYSSGRSDVNVIDAASNGASNAVPMVANIAANLIAFISLLEFLNSALTWFGQRVGIEKLTVQATNIYISVKNSAPITYDCRK